MSDFIFSSIPKAKGQLARYIRSIYDDDAPEIREFHGNWGSIAVSHNLYRGFQPFENDAYIVLVVGGPVLCFTDNTFLVACDSTNATEAIFQRFITGQMRWDEDLSGPFAVLLIEKKTGRVTCITDLMMFIPVYQYMQGRIVILGTHVDVLARAADKKRCLDQVSLADFVLNNIVTYPYTSYEDVFQLHPAAIHYYKISSNGFQAVEPEVYWLPRENNPYSDIHEAAIALRKGLISYINDVTGCMSEVAQFISGGEDSRVLSGLLPERLKRKSFTFLDSMNREGRIAKSVAKAFGAEFHVGLRNETHYLDILPEASDLIGSGHQYFHAHSLGLHKICGLDLYSAVFGAYSSDVFLKAFYARKFWGHCKIPFLPKFFLHGETRSQPLKSVFVAQSILREIDQRRLAHVDTIKGFREVSMHEWFLIWPATMRAAIPNLYANRRLFRSYEPFMSKQVVKISSVVPTNWKLNRRLFQHMAKPYLKPVKHLPHADGWMPYYPWYGNFFIHGPIWTCRKFQTKLGLKKANEGPWADWEKLMKSCIWNKLVDSCANGENIIGDIFTKPVRQLLYGKDLTREQKFNLLQALHSIGKGMPQ